MIRFLIDKVFSALGILLAFLLLLGCLLGMIILIAYFNTPSFPWGALIPFSLCIALIIYMLRIWNNKNLTKQEKKAIIFGKY